MSSSVTVDAWVALFGVVVAAGVGAAASIISAYVTSDKAAAVAKQTVKDTLAEQRDQFTRTMDWQREQDRQAEVRAREDRFLDARRDLFGRLLRETEAFSRKIRRLTTPPHVDLEAVKVELLDFLGDFKEIDQELMIYAIDVEEVCRKYLSDLIHWHAALVSGNGEASNAVYRTVRQSHDRCLEAIRLNLGMRPLTGNNMTLEAPPGEMS